MLPEERYDDVCEGLSACRQRHCDICGDIGQDVRMYIWPRERVVRRREDSNRETSKLALVTSIQFCHMELIETIR